MFCNTREAYEGDRIWKEWLGGSDGSKPVCLGDDVFSIERWRFWKERLGAVVELEDEVVVGFGRRALEAMDDAEQEDAYTV